MKTNLRKAFQSWMGCGCIDSMTEQEAGTAGRKHASRLPMSVILECSVDAHSFFSAIRENQIVGLKDSSNYDGIVAGLLVFFSDLSRCFFLDARLVYAHWKSSGRKSIPISFFEENGIEVPCKKLRVNYLYDIDFLINQVTEGNHERNIQKFVCV